MAKDLVIFGAGGFGREASLLVEEINVASSEVQWRLLGFIDNDKAKWGLNMRGYPVLGGWEALEDLEKEVHLICMVGDPRIKRKLVERAAQIGLRFATLIHPEVALAEDVAIGEGVLINKGCLLTINIQICDHVSINPGCGIGHEAVIGAFTTLLWRVNVSGSVKVGEGCLLGSGATLLQGVSIGDGTTVGAGAVVTRDLPENCTAVGVPARVV